MSTIHLSDITASSLCLSAYFFSLCKSKVYGRIGGGTNEATAKKCLGLSLHIYSFAFTIKPLCPELKYRALFPSLIFRKCACGARRGGEECERKIRQNSRKKGSAIPALHTAQTDDTSRLFMIYFLSAAMTWVTGCFVNA
jgi:hypothetical protein